MSMKSYGRSKSQCLTAIIFVFFLLSPLFAEVVSVFRLFINLSASHYGRFNTSYNLSNVVNEFKEKARKNIDLALDVRNITEGLGGWKFLLIDYYGFLQKLQRKDFVPDASSDHNVYRLNNGYLTILQPKEDVTVCASRMREFNDFLRKKNIDFLYVQAPGKLSVYETLLPKGSQNDYSNYNTDSFLELMQKYGITVYDLRSVFNNSDIKNDGLFFRTDHHWTPEAGFIAFQSIGVYLQKHYSFVINPQILSPASYSKRRLNQRFLGSAGRRVGMLFSPPLDDFTIIKPTFQTKFVTNNQEGQTGTGTFEEVLCADTFLKKRYVHLDESYNYYSGDETACRFIKNILTTNKKHIVLIHDSFGRVVIPFLALTCERLTTIDLRRTSISVRDFVDQADPDIVVVLYNPGALTNRTTDVFKRTLFDFD